MARCCGRAGGRREEDEEKQLMASSGEAWTLQPLSLSLLETAAEFHWWKQERAHAF